MGGWGGRAIVDGEQEVSDARAAPRAEGPRAALPQVPNPSPRVFGVPCPERVEGLSPVIPLLETKAVVVDGLLRGVDDGSIWPLEFEMGSPDHCRLIEHHTAVARAYPGVQVETVVFWGRDRSEPHVLRCGRATLDAHQVFLTAMDGDGELRRVVAEPSSIRACRQAVSVLW